MYKWKNYKTIGPPFNGGMGQVRHLYHNYWQKEMAMKQPLACCLRTEAGRRRFYSECERWISLGIHPYIVQCFFVCDLDGIPTAFMEWMDGGSLADHIKSGALYMDVNQKAVLNVLEVALQMAQGLWYAHRKGVLHLDVKPANVLRDQNGCYKLSDFGLAMLLDQENGTKAYTPFYCAPEQEAGKKLDERTDIYCWAVSVLHMLVRDARWKNGIVAGLACRTYLEQSSLTFPDELSGLIIKCLQYDKEQRPENFGSVIKELKKIYNRISDKPYADEYADYDGTSLDARNNIAISYAFLGDLERASKIWQLDTWTNPYHVPSYYNYQLFLRRYYGSCQLNVCQSVETDRVFSQDKTKIASIPLMHKSEWEYSTGAFVRAFAYASKAKNVSEKLFGSSKDIFSANYAFMKEAYKKYGPCVLKSIDIKKTLAIEGEVKENCVLLSYIYGDKILYLNRQGIAYIIDFTVPKIVKHQTPLSKVCAACVSRNGDLLAIADHAGEKGPLPNPYRVRVLDLRTFEVVYRIDGNNFPIGIEYMTFMERGENAPWLIASNGWKVYDWNLNEKERIVTQGFYSCITKENPPVTCLAQVNDLFLLAKSDRTMQILDAYSLETMNKRFHANYYEMQKYKISSVPNRDYVIFLEKQGGYIVYNYLKGCVVTQESFLLNGTEFIHQLSVNLDGSKMAVLCGDRLEERKMADYEHLPEPLWMEADFRTTEELLRKYHSISNIARNLEDTLEKIKSNRSIKEKISRRALEIKLREVRTYYYGSHKPLHEYLRLAAKMAEVYGFHKLKTRVSWTDEEMEFIKLTEDGRFLEEDGTARLGMRISEDNITCLDFVSLDNGEVLKRMVCSANELIGLSKDHCYLICKNAVNHSYKYGLIVLDWA